MVPLAGLPLLGAILASAQEADISLVPVQTIANFQAGQGGWQLGTLAVGNLDSDPTLEIVVPYRNSEGTWFVDAFKLDGTRLPGFPYAPASGEMNVSPTLVDLDGDGRVEILIIQGNQVVALRSNGTVLWAARVNAANYFPDGGYHVLTNGFWWSEGPVFRNRLPDTAVFSSPVSPPIVADVNGDGTRKVVTAWKIDPDPTGSAQDYNPEIFKMWGYVHWGLTGETWSGGVVFLNAATGARNFTYHLHQLVEAGLALGQADNDAALETYVLNDSDSVVCFDKTRPHGLWGKGMLHKQFGKNQRLMTGSYLLGIDVHTADIDGDGRDEVLVAGTQQGTLWMPNETILDDDGAILWRKWLPQAAITNNHGWMNSATMFAANPDHDNRIDVFSFNHGHEIAFRYWHGSELIDHPGWPKNFAPEVPSPPVVGDVDGDGEEDIVIGTYDPAKNFSTGKLFIFSLAGAQKVALSVPGGLKHIPALVDADGDGGLDVVYRSLLGQVYVQNFGARTTNLVSWATHRGNFARDGNRGHALLAAGTPIVTSKTSGYRRTSFSWSTSQPAKAVRVYRAELGRGPFEHVATVSTSSYTEHGLDAGWLYFYELEAVYETNVVRSAPFIVLSSVNSNLLSNAGFEENDNSHWDKWFGEIEPTEMGRSTNAFQGRRSMEVILRNTGSGGSISQYNQYGVPDAFIPVAPGTLYSFGGWFKSGGISQRSEHWLEWSSTKTAANTNERPTLPWPDYFTPHFAVGTGVSQWVYANRVFTMPAGFPNIELHHRYTVAAPASGSVLIDNLFLRPLPTNWTRYIALGSTWRFRVDSPPANWMARSFNDASWPIGVAKFGAGSGPRNIITPLEPGKTSYYFRKQFAVGAGQPEELLLSAMCTDAYGGVSYLPRIFLNGTEVVTTGMDIVSGQGNEVRHFDLHPFVHLIEPGTNTIAVQLRNATTVGWDDVAFDLSLRAVVSSTRPPRISLTNAALDRVWLEVDTPAGTIWQVRSADRLGQGFSRIVGVFTNQSGGPMGISDSGKNAAPARFYQLAPF
jgi:hypothetical protein